MRVSVIAHLLHEQSFPPPRSPSAAATTRELVKAAELGVRRPRSEVGAVHGEVLTLLFRAAFCMGSADGRATNRGCREVMGRASPRPGGEGRVWRDGRANQAAELPGAFRARLGHFAGCPTWRDAALFWQRRYERELSFQPYLLSLRRKMEREKEIETGVLNRTCTAWARPMMQLMVDIWQQEFAMDKKQELLGKYVLKCVELKPSHVFAAWKKWASAERHARAGSD
ncbi:hypothetical protein TeGR_g11770, partial [Tetraparma gracilis]